MARTLQRLNRFHASNWFYAANRELGRVLKTEFVLQYMSERTLRTRVRRGLLKMGQGAFLMRRLENVRGEFSLTALAYNMRRAINLVGVETLVAAARA